MINITAHLFPSSVYFYDTLSEKKLDNVGFRRWYISYLDIFEICVQENGISLIYLFYCYMLQLYC